MRADPNRYDIVALGALNLDYIWHGATGFAELDGMERGAERAVHAKEFQTALKALSPTPPATLGGSATNVARALGHLAPDLRLGLLFAAPDTAKMRALIGTLPENVQPHQFPYAGEPGSSLSILRDGDRQLLTFNDPAGIDRMLVDQFDEVVKILASARFVHVSSMFGTNTTQHVGRILSAARTSRHEAGLSLTVSVDPGHVWAGARLEARDVLEQADILFMNNEELACLGAEQPTIEAQVQVVAGLCRQDPSLVVLKRRALFLDEPDSPDGVPPRATRTGASFFRCTAPRDGDGLAVISSRHDVVQEALPAAAIADSTGAGDVFAAGVLAGLISPQVQVAAAVRIGNAAARRRMQQPADLAFPALPEVLYDETLPLARGPIFISHASSDEGLVAALCNFLQSSGVRDPLYCSSLAGFHRGPGSAFLHDVWINLRAARYALFVVTDGFMASPWCMYEVGVASALRIPSVPLLAPQFKFEDLALPVNEFRGGHLTSHDFLIELARELADEPLAASPAGIIEIVEHVASRGPDSGDSSLGPAATPVVRLAQWLTSVGRR